MAKTLRKKSRNLRKSRNKQFNKKSVRKNRSKKKHVSRIKRHKFKKRFSRKMSGGVFQDTMSFIKAGKTTPTDFTIRYNEYNNEIEIMWKKYDKDKDKEEDKSVTFNLNATITSGFNGTIYAQNPNEQDIKKITQLFIHANKFKKFINDFIFNVKRNFNK